MNMIENDEYLEVCKIAKEVNTVISVTSPMGIMAAAASLRHFPQLCADDSICRVIIPVKTINNIEERISKIA